MIMLTIVDLFVTEGALPCLENMTPLDMHRLHRYAIILVIGESGQLLMRG